MFLLFRSRQKRPSLVIARQKGFSLLELAIALSIFGILLFGAAGAMKKSKDFDRYVENRFNLEMIHSAMLTYVQVNGYLPCPDTDADGLENREGGALFECTSKNGQLPFQDLGVASRDMFGQPYYYAINNKADSSGSVEIANTGNSASYFNNQSAPVFVYNTPPYGAVRGSGNYTVCAESAGVCSGSTADADKVELAAVAVVISFGENGAETWAGNALDAAESENTDNDNYFWQATGSNQAGQFFDDQLIWLSGYDVKYAALRSGAGLQ